MIPESNEYEFNPSEGEAYLKGLPSPYETINVYTPKAEQTEPVNVEDDWYVGQKFTTPETGNKIFTVREVKKHDVVAYDSRSASNETWFAKSYITRLQPPSPAEHIGDVEETAKEHDCQYRKELSETLEWTYLFYDRLNELVQLKQEKEEDGETANYLERKPIAWELAKEVISLWRKSDYGVKPLPDHWQSQQQGTADWQSILKIIFEVHEKYLPKIPIDHEQSELYMCMAKKIISQSQQSVSSKETEIEELKNKNEGLEIIHTAYGYLKEALQIKDSTINELLSELQSVYQKYWDEDVKHLLEKYKKQ